MADVLNSSCAPAVCPVALQIDLKLSQVVPGNKWSVVPSPKLEVCCSRTFAARPVLPCSIRFWGEDGAV